MKTVSPTPLDLKEIREELPNHHFPLNRHHDAVEFVTWFLNGINATVEDLFKVTYAPHTSDYVVSDIVFRPQAFRPNLKENLDDVAWIQLPDVLMIQLLKFNGYSQKKDIRTTKFEEQITIKAGDGSHTYKLRGVIAHIGKWIGSGHYIAYVVDEYGWVEINNTDIRECPFQHTQVP